MCNIKYTTSKTKTGDVLSLPSFTIKGDLIYQIFFREQPALTKRHVSISSSSSQLNCRTSYKTSQSRSPKENVPNPIVFWHLPKLHGGLFWPFVSNWCLNSPVIPFQSREKMCPPIQGNFRCVAVLFLSPQKRLISKVLNPPST